MECNATNGVQNRQVSNGSAEMSANESKMDYNYSKWVQNGVQNGVQCNKWAQNGVKCKSE